MATLTAIQRLRKEHDRTWMENYSNFKSMVIESGQYGTIEGQNLKVGDVLPNDDPYIDNSAYEIISVRMQRADAIKVTIVTAITEDVVDTTPAQSPWAELRQSRRVMDTRDFKRFQITFTGATDALRPRRGQTYRDITGTTDGLAGNGIDVEPRIGQIVDVQEVTRKISHVTVIFESPWAREGSLESTKNYWCTFNRQHWADEGDDTDERDTGVERYYVQPFFEPRKVASKLRGRKMRGTSGG